MGMLRWWALGLSIMMISWIGHIAITPAKNITQRIAEDETNTTTLTQEPQYQEVIDFWSFIHDLLPWVGTGTGLAVPFIGALFEQRRQF